jgi:hypothetical protein
MKEKYNIYLFNYPLNLESILLQFYYDYMVCDVIIHILLIKNGIIIIIINLILVKFTLHHLELSINIDQLNIRVMN